MEEKDGKIGWADAERGEEWQLGFVDFYEVDQEEELVK